MCDDAFSLLANRICASVFFSFNIFSILIFYIANIGRYKSQKQKLLGIFYYF